GTVHSPAAMPRSSTAIDDEVGEHERPAGVGDDAVTPAGGRAADGVEPAWWRFPVSRYLAVLAVLMVTVWVSANHLPPNVAYPGGRPVHFLGDSLLEGWMRYDAGWYAGIADRGYSY